MDRTNNPPEHLPSEESKWMQNNDYGYAAKNENVMAEPPTKSQETLANLGDKARQSFDTYSMASRELSDAQDEYDRATRALKELKERYQRAFFQMNENLEEVNGWLNSRQKSQSVDS